MEKQPFFRAAMAGLGKYSYGRIGVYRVKLNALWTKIEIKSILPALLYIFFNYITYLSMPGTVRLHKKITICTAQDIYRILHYTGKKFK